MRHFRLYDTPLDAEFPPIKYLAFPSFQRTPYHWTTIIPSYGFPHCEKNKIGYTVSSQGNHYCAYHAFNLSHHGHECPVMSNDDSYTQQQKQATLPSDCTPRDNDAMEPQRQSTFLKSWGFLFPFFLFLFPFLCVIDPMKQQQNYFDFNSFLHWSLSSFFFLFPFYMYSTQ
jgi:hypothetical protein